MAFLSEFNEENQKQSPNNSSQPPQKDDEKSSSSSSSPPKASPSKQEKEEEKNKRKGLTPNKSNGLDMGNYSWGQSLQEVTINVPVPTGTKARLIQCDIKTNHIKVALKGQADAILEGELFNGVMVEDCFWSLEDQKNVYILLTKRDKMEWWKFLVKGAPEIDTQKVEPEPSRLSELHPETRAAVEKMMFDQRQKERGLPTSKEIEDQAMLKKLREQFPDMNFPMQR